MIVSASRRTDIPKFFAGWFMDRVRAGQCSFPNPFNPKQVLTVSLRPEDVEVLVFWSKDPRPLLPYLGTLETAGFRFYFHFTLNGYPQPIEPNVPSLDEALAAFVRLSDALSPERVIWRYDPIILSNLTGPSYHERRFREIARALKGRTRRLMVSIVEEYASTRRGFRKLSREGIHVKRCDRDDPELRRLLATMAEIAMESGMEIFSCAEPSDLSQLGIRHGKCIDNEYIERVFGVRVTDKKDPSQRPACGCVQSRDIGVYGTCRHGCVYCYASHGHILSQTSSCLS